MMTMKIETIELTVPQRRLMEIFAKLDGNGDFDDKRVRRLLEYMRELLNQEKVQAKTLGEMLDGTLPPIDFYGYYDATMRDLYECDSDCYSPAPDELSEADYQDSLIQCFPKIILELLPKPEKWIDPAKNLILTWEMGYDRYIHDEVWHTSEETRRIFRIVSDYIEVRAYGWPFMMEHFLSDWTNYLLTREWPDNEAFYQQKWQTEKALRESYQNVNTHLVEENHVLKDSLKERFITLTDAARAVLRVIYGQDNVDKEADALRKRISRNNPDMPIAFTGKQGRTFYSVETLIPVFIADRQIGLTEGQIATAIRPAGKSREELEG